MHIFLQDKVLRKIKDDVRFELYRQNFCCSYNILLIEQRSLKNMKTIVMKQEKTCIFYFFKSNTIFIMNGTTSIKEREKKLAL